MCLALGAGHGAPDLIWCGGHVPLLGTIAPPAQKHCVQLTASLLQHPDTSGHLCRELFRFPGKGKVGKVVGVGARWWCPRPGTGPE